MQFANTVQTQQSLSTNKENVTQLPDNLNGNAIALTPVTIVDAADACPHESTKTMTQHHWSTFVWACALGLFGGLYCITIPFWMDGYKTINIYCLKCKKKLSSSFLGDFKRANIILSVLLAFNLTFTIAITAYVASL